ncbi:Ca(2+)-dependent cysteine protease [Tulasnella sp. JGI-2019a]|nr:Ca(2+)-dependent cysteine protease [Tulasnella sp. JGI-2019a]
MSSFFPSESYPPSGGYFTHEPVPINMPNHPHQNHRSNTGGFSFDNSPPGGYGSPPGSSNEHHSRGPTSSYNTDIWGPNNGVPYVPSTGSPPDMGRQPFPYQHPTAVPQMPPSQMQSYAPPQGQNLGGQDYMYSQCNGRKKALLIGINYTGTDKELQGCQNDVKKMKQFIERHYRYQDGDVVMLTDEPHRQPNEQPTRANIISGMQWLVRNAQANDSLFFHFSGHGGFTEDLDGDESDGFDQVIYPVDHTKTGHIVDDEMHDIMVSGAHTGIPLPLGCRLTAIFDSCHSGTALDVADLPFVYSTEGKIKGGTKLLSRQNSAREFIRNTKGSPADVISWSACKDDQKCVDTMVDGQATGVMSWAFMRSLNHNPQQSYQQLLVSIRALLKQKYSQRPQLSSSHPMNMDILFIV